MKNFQQRKGWKERVRSKPSLIFLGIIIIALAWSVLGLIGKTMETAKNRKLAEEKIAELEQKKIKLTSDIEKLNTDRGMEENIRDKFGLAKEGEGMILVVDDKTVEGVNKEPESNGFFSIIKGWFE